MSDKPNRPNRHIVDQLADVRAEIKELENREKDLKEQVGKMMGSADSLGGDEWIAKQSMSTRKGSIDADELDAWLKHIGLAVTSNNFRKADSIIVTIRVEKRVQEETP